MCRGKKQIEVVEETCLVFCAENIGVENVVKFCVELGVVEVVLVDQHKQSIEREKRIHAARVVSVCEEIDEQFLFLKMGVVHQGGGQELSGVLQELPQGR